MFDTKEIINQVRALAAERPDFIYPNANKGCFYWQDGPSCLIGQALYRLGASEATLVEYDVRVREPDCDGSIEDVIACYADDFTSTHEDASWLNGVQSEQDVGQRWGDAVRHADAERARAEESHRRFAEVNQ